MNLPQSLVPWLALLALVPAPVVAQTTPEAPITDSGFSELAVLGLLIYVVYVIFSIAIGVLVLVVSEFVFSGSYVRAIEKRAYDQPVGSGVLGLGVFVGGVVGFILLLLVFLFLMAFGVPEFLGMAGVIPLFGGILFTYVASALGTIVFGSYVLRRFGDGESNLWLALVVGALVVNIPVLNFVLGFLVLFLGMGAMVGQWWSNRQDAKTGPNQHRPVDR
ncbi:hypothetical protein ACFQGT_17100 [Natrialbaceae archaeon GCM10025810]|uniref:hypothetical protein n=1 Tax=Halovalidus salilacus TaxID=3075124 RepID=UPI00360A4173